MIGKVGDGNRVTIPAEIRHNLNISIGDNLNISVDGNKIILEKEENDSESGLNNIENENKSSLQKTLEESQNDETYWDRGVLKHKVILETNKEPKCSCGNDLGDSKFLINGELVCRNCRDALRDHLIMEINYRKRLEQAQD